MRERESERKRERENGQQFTYAPHSHINTTNTFSTWTLISLKCLQCARVYLKAEREPR